METKHTQHVTDTPAHVALDQCRVAFMAVITAQYLDLLMQYQTLPNGMNRNVLKQTADQLHRCVREVKRTTIPHNPHYLDRNLKEPKILDIATVVDAMARIGLEESPDIYEEFLGLMVDCIDSVFYAQQNRKKMHFGKYRLLFESLSKEIKADVNGQPGQFFYNQHKKELYIRTDAPHHESEMK